MYSINTRKLHGNSSTIEWSSCEWRQWMPLRNDVEVTDNNIGKYACGSYMERFKNILPKSHKNVYLTSTTAFFVDFFLLFSLQPFELQVICTCTRSAISFACGKNVWNQSNLWGMKQFVFPM